MVFGTLDHTAGTLSRQFQHLKPMFESYCLHLFGAFRELDMLAHSPQTKFSPTAWKRQLYLAFLLLVNTEGLFSMYNYSLFINKGP